MTVKLAELAIHPELQTLIDSVPILVFDSLLGSIHTLWDSEACTITGELNQYAQGNGQPAFIHHEVYELPNELDTLLWSQYAHLILHVMVNFSPDQWHTFFTTINKMSLSQDRTQAVVVLTSQEVIVDNENIGKVVLARNCLQ